MFAVVLVTLLKHSMANLETLEDLSSAFYDVFKTGNRNAASHLWVKYISDRAHTMPEDTFENLFHGFCAISGSPIPDVARTEYKAMLPKVNGGHVTGVTRHCCWPCVCDITELVHVDTKTINTADGPKSFNFLVIGDPCKHPEQLRAPYTDSFTGAESMLSEEAPEVKCENGALVNAIFSDHGHPIIGMLFDAQPGLHNPMLDQMPPEFSGSDATDPTFGFGKMCTDRREHGYNSGMGKIFHLVAKITPIGQGTNSISQKFEIETGSIATDDVSALPRNEGTGFVVLLAAFVSVAALAMVWRWRAHPEAACPRAANFEMSGYVLEKGAQE
jgi:hypothetical protein